MQCKRALLHSIFQCSSNNSSKQAGGYKVPATTSLLKTGIEVAQNGGGGNKHHHEQVSCCFEPSSAFYGRFSVQR